MSIIEKAVGRLGRGKGEKDVSPDVAGADAEPLIAAKERRTLVERAAAADRAIAPESAVIAERPVVTEAPKIKQPTPSSRVVELNLDKLHEMGMVTPDGGRSAVAEEFRAIKRTLIDKAFKKDAIPSKRSNLIMVTSSLPGEGKTFCAINLAISIAMELDHTVLLVDADVARPSILRNLGLKAGAGLMDVLLDRNLDVADVMLKTNVDTLSILPAGTSHRHATELLASQAMRTLLDEISARYADRIVIFDSPPLLLTTEASVLASQMGQIVMVIEAEKTTQKAVKNALHQLESCPNVNLIYNKANAFPGGEKYGFYYG
ncbi:MAG: XrtA-associated tyrosine autokinase [Pseudomonadota bacterium]